MSLGHIPRPKYLNLSYMCISARLLVLEDGDLDVHSLDCGPIAVIEREDIPAKRLAKLDHFDFLEFVETVGHPNGDLLGRVTLICLEIQVKGKFANLSLS